MEYCIFSLFLLKNFSIYTLIRLFAQYSYVKPTIEINFHIFIINGRALRYTIIQSDVVNLEKQNTIHQCECLITGI